MKEVPLETGGCAIVDDEDFGLVNRYRWRGNKRRSLYCAATTIHGRTVRMHRMLVQAAPGQHVHHVNGNPLDNRRENLQLLTPGEHNKTRRRPGSVGVIHTEKRRRGYRVTFHLGSYDSEEEATVAANLVYSVLRAANIV